MLMNEGISWRHETGGLPPPVQGFTFSSHAETIETVFNNGNICQIIRRADEHDNVQLENGPAFWVRFGDGREMIAYGSELSPWYPT